MKKMKRERRKMTERERCLMQSMQPEKSEAVGSFVCVCCCFELKCVQAGRVDVDDVDDDVGCGDIDSDGRWLVCCFSAIYFWFFN